MRVATTGSRQSRPDAVCRALRKLLIEWGATELHHGDCIGWDKQAHDVAVSLGLKTVSHPPDIDSMRAYCVADETMYPLPYIERNKAIVLACNRIIAAPDGPERTGSGTWSTVRMALRLGRKGMIIVSTHS